MGVLTETMMRLRDEIVSSRHVRLVFQRELARQTEERRLRVSALCAAFARDRAGAHRAWFGPTLSELRTAPERQRKQQLSEAARAKAQEEQRRQAEAARAKAREEQRRQAEAARAKAQKEQPPATRRAEPQKRETDQHRVPVRPLKASKKR